ncbi:ABC transporter ATP-binding protein [Ensifer sp. ENS06]|uniref:ABC transporter ATP-binding protein n=1 Tax=Ensifer sp. ENS06 TaxID=2769276 RepID=UPI001784EF84|nr:ABC transporter ATP-binding protein [Ensifer sp. ENS06]MBD9628177.1 ABC transporter ATP-binding protein [Ensifer sp. ENS06]
MTFAWARPIAAHAKSRAWLLALSCALAIVASALTILPYLVAYRLIALALAADMSQMAYDLPWLAATAVAAIVLKHLCLVASTLVAHAASFGVLHELRLAIARKCVLLPLDFFSRNATGRLKSVMRDDVDSLEDALAHAISDIACGIATPILMLAFLAFFDWRLTLVLALLLPLLIAVYMLTMRSKRALIGEYGRKIVAFNGLAIEFVRGMKTLKSFGADEAVSARLMEIISDLADINRRAELASLKPWVVFLVGLRAALMLIVPVGGALYLAGQLDVITFALFVLIALVFTQPLLNLVYTAGSFFWKVSLAGRNITWLMEADELAATGGSTLPEDDTIVLRDVSLAYGGVGVLRDINLRVEPGTMTALIGPSGAGKSSLARIIARFMDPQSGVVSIGGVDVRTMPEADLLGRIGIMFQDTFLFNDTIFENILIGRPDASVDEVRVAARRAQVLEFADRMPEGLDTRVGDNGGNLSGGQRQRIAIARLILKDAPIVLLDEATASLDPDCEALVQEALSELSRDRTLIVIAHRLHTIRHADQIVFMQAGKITAAGTHVDLLADLEYARFWKAHEGTGPVPLALEDFALPMTNGRETGSNPAHRREVCSESGESQEGAARFAQGWRDWLQLSGKSSRAIFSRAVPLLSLEVLAVSAPVAISIGVLLAAAQGGLTASALAAATAALFACYLLAGVFSFAAQRCLFGVQRDAVSNLQRAIVAKLAALPIGFFQSRGAAMLNTLFSAHLFQLDFVTPPGQMVRAVFVPLLSGIVLIVLDWRLGLALFAGVPIFLLVLAASSESYGKAWNRLVASREEANARSVEFLLGLPVIRAYRLLDGKLSRFSDALAHERAASWAATRSLALSAAAAPAVLELGFVGVIIAGASLLVGRQIDLDLFVLFVVVGLVFYRPMFEVLDLMSYGRAVARSAREVRGILSKPTLQEGNGALLRGQTHDLRFEKVGFRYESGAGLSNISFSATKGTMTALVGPSGSGKSTVLALATRFWDALDGTVRLGGTDLRDLAPRAVHGSFSVVFQETFLICGSIAANIRLGVPDATAEDVEGAARSAMAHEFIEGLPDGYDTVVGDGGLSLSGGERQRIGIARAILNDAPILLLDEPTASVDPEAEQKIRTALKVAAMGKTVLVATHNMDIAAEADQIIVLADGAIIERGTDQELLRANATYATLRRLYQKSRSWTLRSLDDETSAAEGEA